jgi:hypothetical protein
MGTDVASGKAGDSEEGMTANGTPVAIAFIRPVGSLEIGVDRKGGLETGNEGDDTLWLKLSGAGNGVELNVGMEAGISLIGDDEVMLASDGIAVAMESLFVGDVEGCSLISMRFTTCPESVYVALATKPQSLSSES